MRWIIIKLLQYQLYKVRLEVLTKDNDIIIKAYFKMIKNYENSIMFLKSHKGN